MGQPPSSISGRITRTPPGVRVTSLHRIDDVSLGDLPKVVRVIKAAKRYKKVNSKPKSPDVSESLSCELWDSKGPDPGGLPMKTLNKWVPEALYGAWKAGVSKFFWLSLRDWAREPGLPYSQTFEAGLYFRGDTLEADRPKPFLKNFRFPFVSYRKGQGLLVWGRTPTSTGGTIKVSYRKNGGWRKLTTVRAGSNGVFNKFVRTRLGRKNKGSVRARVVGGPALAAGQKQTPVFPLKPIKDFRQPPFG